MTVRQYLDDHPLGPGVEGLTTGGGYYSPYEARDFADIHDAEDAARRAENDKRRGSVRRFADDYHDDHHVGSGVESFTECRDPMCVELCEAMGIVDADGALEGRAPTPPTRHPQSRPPRSASQQPHSQPFVTVSTGGCQTTTTTRTASAHTDSRCSLT